MRIIIEVGTLEQKELIENELKLVFDIAAQFDRDLGINKIIVPVNFDATVNALQGTTSYQSVRNLGDHDVVAQAKVVNTLSGWHIVISPYIFSEHQDDQTRCFIYMHELVHVTTKRVKRDNNALSKSDSIYAHSLETFVDEYIADRKAYAFVDKVFPAKSESWQAEVVRQASQFSSLLENPTYLASIKLSIKELQNHHDITRFLDAIHPIFDSIFLVLAHSFSLSDSYPELLPLSKLASSKFVNERSIALLEYVREQFQKSAHELDEGLVLMTDFMRNFGIAFRDSSDGLVCHVDYSDF